MTDQEAEVIERICTCFQEVVFHFYETTSSAHFPIQFLYPISSPLFFPSPEVGPCLNHCIAKTELKPPKSRNCPSRRVQINLLTSQADGVTTHPNRKWQHLKFRGRVHSNSMSIFLMSSKKVNARRARIKKTIIDDTLIDADEPFETHDIISNALMQNLEKFTAVMRIHSCEFSSTI
jgi:hypothetical protein